MSDMNNLSEAFNEYLKGLIKTECANTRQDDLSDQPIHDWCDDNGFPSIESWLDDNAADAVADWLQYNDHRLVPSSLVERIVSEWCDDNATDCITDYISNDSSIYDAVESAVTKVVGEATIKATIESVAADYIKSMLTPEFISKAIFDGFVAMVKEKTNAAV